MQLQNPKGTKDLNPEEKILMNKVINTLSRTFELYGYNPVEFPILEKFETLSAKFAAGEGSDALKETFKLKDQGNRDLGLRFDLTVPFSRFVGMNPTMKMPFKKYVMGNVFRDGPVKLGRMREFFQIDPDIIGVKDVIADAEIISLATECFKKLELDTYSEYNTRTLLNNILEYAEIKNKEEVIIIIDKLKKLGEETVKKELSDLKLNNEKINKIMDCIRNEPYDKKIKKLKSLLKSQEGIEEIEKLTEFLKTMKVKDANFNPSLARGLSYYTGPIYEFFLKKSKITGSVAGGGRYDKMIGNYLDQNKDFPATGISFGVSVIIEALKEKKIKVKKSITKIYIIPIKTIKESLKIATELREKNINVDIDLLQRGPSKNLDFANVQGIPYVLFVGPKELKEEKYTLRDMSTGKESKLNMNSLVKTLT
jgi:histidyl-tRNA synthetase